MKQTIYLTQGLKDIIEEHFPIHFFDHAIVSSAHDADLMLISEYEEVYMANFKKISEQKRIIFYKNEYEMKDLISRGIISDHCHLIHLETDKEIFHFNLRQMISHIYFYKTIHDKVEMLDMVAKSNLEKIRELYMSSVKKRTEKFHDHFINCKFKAGESTGGEFFDFIETKVGFAMYAYSAQSYVDSSYALGKIEEMKIKKIKFQDVMVDLRDYFENVKKNVSENFQFTLINIDFVKNKLDAFTTDRVCLVINDHIVDFQGSFEKTLGRGEFVSFISSGFYKNWSHYNTNGNYKEFLQNQISLFKSNAKNHTSIEESIFLDEMFYSLFKMKPGIFLKHDAFMLELRMGQRVLFEVS